MGTIWVVVKELKVSCQNSDTIVFTYCIYRYIDPYSANLNLSSL